MIIILKLLQGVVKLIAGVGDNIEGILEYV